MNTFKTAIAVAVGTLFAGAAIAQSNYEIEQRDRNEQARIERGVQSGQITSREADRLQGERAQIERLEQRARADGTLTQHERARVDGAQDRLSRDIYRESHDRQTSNGNGRQWDNRADNRGNHYGWDNRGNGNNGWGRGDERGYEHGARGGHTGYEQGARGEQNGSQSNGGTPRTWTGTTAGTGNGWAPHTGSTSSSGQSDRGYSRQPSMPQAQARSTPSQATRTVASARQGGGSGRATR